jgi:hypothetical protein
VAQALFRHRLEGHIALRRRFTRPIDFVDVHRAGDEPEVLLPGFQQDVLVEDRQTPMRLAAEALRKTLGLPPGEIDLDDILGPCQNLFLGAETPDRKVGKRVYWSIAHHLPGRTSIDDLIVDGLLRCDGDFDLRVTTDNIFGALIAGTRPPGF